MKTHEHTPTKERDSRLQVLEHFTNAPQDSNFRRRLTEPNTKRVLILPGGGMTGIYSAAALSKFEQLGINPEQTFDTVIGISAGALNGAYYLAGQSQRAEYTWVNHVSDGEFIRFTRPQRLMDVEHLFKNTLGVFAPLQEQRIDNSTTDLLIGLTRKSDGETVFFSDTEAPVSIFEMLEASASAPIVYEESVRIDGVDYVDGGYSEAIPLNTAEALEPEHIVILGANPLANKGVSWLYRQLFMAASNRRGYSPTAQNMHIRGHHIHNDISDRLRSLRPDAGNIVIDGIFPEPGKSIGRLEPRQSRIARAAAHASRDVELLLNG